MRPVNHRRKAATLAPAPAANGFSSYPPEEATFLVKDLSGVLVEVTRAEYEEGINRGRHYAEMLPEEEYRPTAEAVTLFEHALNQSARRLALAVGITTGKVLALRTIGRAWLRIIWACWRSKTAYDPARHEAAKTTNHRIGG